MLWVSRNGGDSKFVPTVPSSESKKGRFCDMSATLKKRGRSSDTRNLLFEAVTYVGYL
jgi:hypothetical protein